jgi:hypothetical protein
VRRIIDFVKETPPHILIMISMFLNGISLGFAIATLIYKK